MSGVYTVQFNGVTWAGAAQVDLWEINTAAGKPCWIHAFELSQISEVADAQEEGLLILVKRGQTTSGSGGSTATPVPLDPGMPAAGFTTETNNTTKASAGTIVTLMATAWNVRVTPMKWEFTPETRIFLPASARLTIELATNPADAITGSSTVWVEEVG